MIMTILQILTTILQEINGYYDYFAENKCYFDQFYRAISTTFLRLFIRALDITYVEIIIETSYRQ